MAFKFPWTNLHELNLDWIIKHIPTKTSQLINDSGFITDVQPGTVFSVNSKTGVVTLDANDVGALPDTYTAPVQTVNGFTGNVMLDASEIPTSDSSTVQQHIDDLEEYEPLLITWTASSGALSKSDARISSDMRVIDIQFGSPNNVLSDITWTTSAGTLTISGTINNTTTVTAVLAKVNT